MCPKQIHFDYDKIVGVPYLTLTITDDVCGIIIQLWINLSDPDKVRFRNFYIWYVHEPTWLKRIMNGSVRWSSCVSAENREFKLHTKTGCWYLLDKWFLKFSGVSRWLFLRSPSKSYIYSKRWNKLLKCVT